VRIAGHDLDEDATAVRRRIGIIFRNPSVDLHLSGEENIRLHVAPYGRSGSRPFYRVMPAAYRARIEELAEVIGLGDLAGNFFYAGKSDMAFTVLHSAWLDLGVTAAFFLVFTIVGADLFVRADRNR
jgi:hypothetical protein